MRNRASACVAPERSRDHHELVHYLRVPDGGLERDAAAEGVPHDVGSFEAAAVPLNERVYHGGATIAKTTSMMARPGSIDSHQAPAM